VIRGWAQRYADRLGHHCLQAPQQWFNFFPFWNTHDDTPA
jgi:predicted LPLAT superfamily acyltransferase